MTALPPPRPVLLPYRVGSFTSFSASMRRRLHHEPVLASLAGSAQGDFTTALIGAWARVCDILSFYQERIAQEGFLASAVEAESVQWLAGSVGCRRRPPLAAHTDLAVQMLEAPGQPPVIMIGPRRPLAVQNIPEAGTMPVQFESLGQIEIRTAWNAIALTEPALGAAQQLWPGCRSLRLAGTRTGLKAGDGLLISFTGAGSAPSSLAVVVASLIIDRAAGCTVVIWRDGLSFAEVVDIATVTALKPRARLFGWSAADWATQSAAVHGSLGICPGGVVVCQTTTTGQPALWRALGDGAPPGDLRTVLADSDGSLLAGTSLGLSRLNGEGVWQMLPLPPGRHDVRALMIDPSGALYAGTAAGSVLMAVGARDSWAVLPDRTLIDGKPAPLASPVRALVAGTDGNGDPALFLGNDQGVYTTTPSKTEWALFRTPDLLGIVRLGGANLTGCVTALALFAGRLVAATTTGLFASPLGNADWRKVDLPGGPGFSPQSLVVANSGATLFVGGRQGVMATPDLRRWAAFNRGLGTSGPVSALVALAGQIGCICGGRVFVTTDSAAGWQAVAVDEVDLFHCLPVLADGLAAPSQVPAELRARFAMFAAPLARDVTVVAPVPASDGQAAADYWDIVEPAAGQSSPGRHFRLYPGNDLRVTQIVPAPAAAGTNLAVVGGNLVAALPPGAILNSDWPDFAIQGGDVVLDRKLDQLAAGDAFVLVPDGVSVVVAPGLRTVDTTETAPWRAFGKQAAVTRVTTAANAALAATPLRTTRFFQLGATLDSYAAQPAAAPPLAGHLLHFATSAENLTPGRRLAIGGPGPAAAVLSGADQPVLTTCTAAIIPLLDQQQLAAELGASLKLAGVSLSRAASVWPRTPGLLWVLLDGDSAWRIAAAGQETDDPGATPDLQIAPMPIWEVIGPATEVGADQWHLVSADRCETAVHAAADLMWLPACSWQGAKVELATLASIGSDAGNRNPTGKLTAALTGAFDWATCRINANLVAMRQGERVEYELLGSGQGSDRNQRQSFRLQRKPLTWQPGAFGRKAKPMLAITLGGTTRTTIDPRDPLTTIGAPVGERWTLTPALSCAGPADRVYALDGDGSGGTIVRFGDGTNGAAPPLGQNNISASYVAGGGAAGNIAANSLKALRTRMAGIKTVSNPVAASGGTDAEPIDELRARATRHLRYFDRIVSLGDYASFARDYPGVREAALLVVAAAAGDPPARIHLTIVGEPGVVLDASAIAGLAAAIEGCRADRTPLTISPARQVPFGLTVEFTSAPGTDGAAVARHVRAALLARFGAGQLRLATSISAAELGVAAQAVRGVQSARVTALTRLGVAQDGAGLIAAEATHDATGAFTPGEVLFLDDGLTTRVICR